MLSFWEEEFKDPHHTSLSHLSLDLLLNSKQMNMPITQDSAKLRGHLPKLFVVFDVLRVQVKTVSAGINLYLKLGQFDLSSD